MTPFTIVALDHVVLRVADEARSLDFYVGVLGCTLEKRQDEIGLTHLRAGSALIDLVPGDGAPSEGRNVDHFALEIAPFDAAAIRAHLTAHGVPIGEAGRRYGAKGYGPSLYIADPDGNTVELKGPSEPGTQETAPPR